MVKQVIIVRKDILKQKDEDIFAMNKDQQKLYFEQLEETGKISFEKLSVQFAHASFMAVVKKARSGKPYTEAFIEDSININLDKVLKEWFNTGFKKVFLEVKSEEKLRNIQESLTAAGIVSELIEDLGFNQLKKPTVTCLGVEPLEETVIDKFTKRLRVLKIDC